MLAGGGQDAVQFGGPTLRVLAAARLRRDPQLARLGPDILAAGASTPRPSSRRCAPTRAASLGDALLDQHLVAGIGNIFKSEACFAARVDPWRPLGDLSDEELRAVLAAAREQMLEAVDQRPPHLRRLPRAAGPARSAAAAISSRGQGDANRTTYWCPRCQG